MSLMAVRRPANPRCAPALRRCVHCNNLRYFFRHRRIPCRVINVSLQGTCSLAGRVNNQESYVGPFRFPSFRNQNFKDVKRSAAADDVIEKIPNFYRPRHCPSGYRSETVEGEVIQWYTVHTAERVPLVSSFSFRLSSWLLNLVNGEYSQSQISLIF